MMTKAGTIVSQLKTPLMERLKQRLSSAEKGEVREKLKREISTALKAGGIPPEMIDKMTLVFANKLTSGVEHVHVELDD